MKKIAVFINPISGGIDKKSLVTLIRERFKDSPHEIEILIPGSAAEVEELCKKKVQEGIDAIVAAGGDGTTNLLARNLIDTSVCLGIIPLGSGNGYARGLGIPMNTSKAIDLIKQFHTRKLDTGTVNGKVFLNIAGVGFDAHVAKLFAGSSRRGFWNYVKITIREYFRFRNQVFDISIGDTKFRKATFLASVNIGPEFGNHAIIAPQAAFNDGKFIITIIRNIRFLNAPVFALRLFTGTIKPNSSIEIYKSDKISINGNKKTTIHIDGEPYTESDNIEFRLRPLSLNVIVP